MINMKLKLNLVIACAAASMVCGTAAQQVSDAAEEGEVIGLPLTAFTDHAGRVVHLHLGEVHREQAEIVFAAIARLRAGDMQLAAARQQISEQIQATAYR